MTHFVEPRAKNRFAFGRPGYWALVLFSFGSILTSAAPAPEAGTTFRNEIRPILEEYCYDCHGDGANKGNVAFDELKDDHQILDNHELWLKALRNLRAGLMPPARKPQPSAAQKERIEAWIKSAVFRADPGNPDPGRVTVRRLNRVEYRNTIRDLMGVDFDTEKEFPPDDAGYGFDNIGDVLSVSPMLLEKYLAAAQKIVANAVPAVSAVAPEKVIDGRHFKGAAGRGVEKGSRGSGTGLALSYYEEASVTNRFEAAHAGKYHLALDFTTSEKFVDNHFDYNKCRLTFKADNQELLTLELTREGTKPFHFEFDQNWSAGEHDLVWEVHPLTPDAEQVRALAVRIDSVTVRGPLDAREFWVHPKDYARFFPKAVPEGTAERRAYAREILEHFLEKAYRRPASSTTVDRLVSLAEATWSQPDKSFEAGISEAMTAVLASPRFLFREEGAEPLAAAKTGPAAYPLVDEYTLASRLSYFLWSSMPDDQLFALARKHQLRENLAEQIKRMLADHKSEALIRNLVGQWLQVRDIDTIQIDARQVLAQENAPDPELERRRTRFRELRLKEQSHELSADEKKELDEARAVVFRRPNAPPRAELNGELRRAMRQETEKTFEHVLREDRSLLELLDCNYTYLNERLAKHYGLTNLNVKGDEVRLVQLPPGSGRGGILTDGSVLVVTSNPTRTSPVKRGKFILENLLGTPPAPPPPDIPPLEDAGRGNKGRTLTFREMLAVHREQALCSSCHNRMDPLGLALENFNALGMWRDHERGQPIDATGKLLSGESFTNIIDLKEILVRNHAVEFYRTLTEKLLTYALGRGLDYYDVVTVDGIVQRLEQTNGRPSALLSGVIESAPFQKTRSLPVADPSKTTQTAALEPQARKPL